MQYDCTHTMAQARRMAMDAMTRIMNESGGTLDGDEINDLHHALEIVQIIGQLEGEGQGSASPPPQAQPSPPTAGGGNGGASTAPGGTDLSAVLDGIERMIRALSGMQMQPPATGGTGGAGGGGAGDGASVPETGTPTPEPGAGTPTPTPAAAR